MNDLIPIPDRESVIEQAYTAVIDAINNKSTQSYIEMYNTVSKVAQLLLIEKASASALAAVELAKQYGIQPTLNYTRKNNKDILKEISALPLNNDQLKLIKDKLMLTSTYTGALKSDDILQEMEKGNLTIWEGEALLKTITITKEESNQNINLNFSEELSALVKDTR